MINWGRSEDGHVYSKCGEYAISPVYWGCCSAQGYELVVVNARDDNGTRIRVSFGCDTQAEAKRKADQYERTNEYYR